MTSGGIFRPKLGSDSVTRHPESVSVSGSDFFYIVAHVTGEAKGGGVLNFHVLSFRVRLSMSTFYLGLGKGWDDGERPFTSGMGKGEGVGSEL